MIPTNDANQYFKFQHTAARRRLQMVLRLLHHSHNRFNTQPRGGGCHFLFPYFEPYQWFQHTAARRRLQRWFAVHCGQFMFQHTAARRRLQFNGGYYSYLKKFQHTAARRRLQSKMPNLTLREIVSTHSRAEAAAHLPYYNFQRNYKFQHTAARRRLRSLTSPVSRLVKVSTHSRAEAAALYR